LACTARRASPFESPCAAGYPGNGPGIKAGVLFEGQCQLEPNTPVEMSFLVLNQFSGRAVAVILCAGRVVHTVKLPSGPPALATRIWDYRLLPSEGNRTKAEHAALLSSGPDVTVGVILPDDRMIYARREEPPVGRDFNLWVIKVNPRTGKPRSSPRRLTSWTETGVHSLSISADGKRVACVKTHRGTPGQANVWLLANF